MGKPLAVDYEKIKALFINGLPLPDLAERFNVKYNTLRQRAHREGWQKLATEVSHSVTRAVTDSVTQGAKSHVNRVLKLVDRHIESVERRSPDAMDLESFDMLTKIVDRLDQIGRRSHGLDAEQANARSATLVQVVINTKDTALTPIDVDTDGVIDVESSQGPATGPS
jgi:hypothetical protein